MDFFYTTIGEFMHWLSIHDQIAYVILFIGSYLETLIFTSVIVPGEVFLLAGFILAGAGVLKIWFVSVAIFAGAILGDNSSYFIGKKLGPSFFKEGRFIFNTKNYARGEAFFKKHGKKAIFLARLLGPLSWITPFLAGVYGIRYRDFLKYNLPGIFIGIGEFLVVGYFFGSQYEAVLLIVQKYVLFVVLLLIVICIGIWYFKKRRASRRKDIYENQPSNTSIQ